MARRDTPSARPQRPNHTIEEKKQDILRLKRRIAELEALDPNTLQERWSSETTQIETAIDETLSAVFGHGTVEYSRYSAATTLDHGPVMMQIGPDFGGGQHSGSHEARRFVTEGKNDALALLKQAVRGIEEEIELALPPAAPTTLKRTAHASKVFVVHGHDAAAHESMARFLEKLELEAIILHEQADQGLTIIEKFESYADQVGFAVVLLTPDDIGGVVSVAPGNQRARQNVIFELGYFVGKLGRGKACLVRKGDVEIPSDLAGVIYTDMDVAGAWKMKLVTELKAAGMQFDSNKMWK